MSGRNWWRVALGVGLVAVVLSRTDLAEARRSLAGARIEWLLVAVLAQIAAKLCWAVRWSELLRAAGHLRPLGELLSLVLVGLFFGTFLPGSVSGDVARGYELSARGVPRATAAASLVADRIVGLAALAVAAGAGASLGIAGTIGGSPWVPAVAALAVFGAAAAFAARPALADRMAGGLPGRFGRRARRVAASFALMAGHGARVIASLAASVALVAFSALFHWSLARAIDLKVPFAAWLVIVPAVMLLSAIPLTPNGLGIREAGFVGFLAAQGVPAGSAAIFAVLALLIPLPFALAGGILFARGGRGTVRQVAAAGRDAT